MNIDQVKAIIAKNENRVLELKTSTGELIKGMQSLCAFLNTDGGWLFFGITPKLETLGQKVADATQQEMADEFGCCNQAISKALKRNQITRKKRQPVTKNRIRKE